MSLKQLIDLKPFLKSKHRVSSIFAGRIADTGINPAVNGARASAC